MFSLETFERHFSAIMEALVDAAVIELRRLLTGGSALGVSVQQRPAAAAGTAERGRKSGEEEDRQQAVTHITEQFASLMTSSTKGVLEKITVMVKVSICDTHPAEQKDDADRTNPKPRRKSAARRETNLYQPAVTTRRDHMYCRAEQLTKELSGAPSASESDLEPDEASYEELNSGSLSASRVRLDVSVQEDSRATNATEKRFKCPSCEKTFDRKCLMERHNLIHTKPHSCSECGKPFATRRGLNAHLQKHGGEKLYGCSDCGKEFAYKFTYLRHMRNHAAKKPSKHTCSLCEFQFTDMTAFQRHRCEALKKMFVCSVCPETFQCRRSSADHENVHLGDRGFVCEICGDGFLSSSSLATHRVAHILKENCSDELSLGCSDSNSLRRRQNKHTQEKLFRCEICGKGLSHKSALKHHMLTHTGERPYICEVCGKRCGHASALENHMRIHTGKKPGQKPICSLCGKMFSSARSLRYHSSVHTGEKAHACDQCEKRFSSPIILKAHMNIHSEEKRFGCNVCGRRFTQVSSLKLHRRLHTGEKLFHCIVCGKGFQHRTDLQKHTCNHLPVEAGNGPCG